MMSSSVLIVVFPAAQVRRLIIAEPTTMQNVQNVGMSSLSGSPQLVVNLPKVLVFQVFIKVKLQ